MKKGLKKGLSLLAVTLMLASIVPASVMARETEIPGDTIVQTGNNTGNIQEEVAFFEDGQAIWLSNTKEDAPVKMPSSQNTMQLKDESSQDESFDSAVQTESMKNEYQLTDVDGGVSITKYIGTGENENSGQY